MQDEQRERKRKKLRIQKLRTEIAIGIAGVFFAAMVGLSMTWVVHDRIEKYPHLGTGWIPKTEEQRRIDASPKKWTGR